jgi:hypothetical protein
MIRNQKCHARSTYLTCYNTTKKFMLFDNYWENIPYLHLLLSVIWLLALFLDVFHPQEVCFGVPVSPLCLPRWTLKQFYGALLTNYSYFHRSHYHWLIWSNKYSDPLRKAPDTVVTIHSYLASLQHSVSQDRPFASLPSLCFLHFASFASLRTGRTGWPGAWKISYC